MSRQSWPQRHLRLVLTLVGLAVFVPSVMVTNNLAAHQRWLARHGTRTTALITAVSCHRGLCGDHARISFDTKQGPVSTTITLVEAASVGPGSHIPIAYDAANPQDARSMEANFSLPMRELLPALGFILAIVLWLYAGTSSVTRIVRRRRHRTQVAARDDYRRGTRRW